MVTASRFDVIDHEGKREENWKPLNLLSKIENVITADVSWVYTDPCPCPSHYSDVIMGVIACQITSLTIVYSAVYSSTYKKNIKIRVNGLCAGNSPMTGEFPVQMASNTENVSIWWRHHDKKLMKAGAMNSLWTAVKKWTRTQSSVIIVNEMLLELKKSGLFINLAFLQVHVTVLCHTGRVRDVFVSSPADANSIDPASAVTVTVARGAQQFPLHHIT